LRKEKNTIKIKKGKKGKKMNKFIILIISVFLLSSCETISNKTQNLKKPGDKCPPQSERTLADIFCRE